MAFDWLVLQTYGSLIGVAWVRAKTDHRKDPGAPDASVDDILQYALECAAHRRLLERFSQPSDASEAVTPDVQAAFCIDVRSELVRRAFEGVVPNSETLGFAGFFGVAIDVLPLGGDRAHAQCPVLVKPGYTVREAAGAESAGAALKRRDRARFKRAWKRFKNSAVGSFAFVDMFGFFYGVRLMSDALGFTAPAPRPHGFGLGARSDVRPEFSGQDLEDTGLSEAARIDLAENILRGMSLTDRFAPVVLLVGHGSTSRNNPHAAGLDCGACGGHSGELNARVAAQVLNDATVRRALCNRGLTIPETTRFVAALHDTVSDDITLFEDGAVPADTAAALTRLRKQLADVAVLARRERGPALLGAHGVDESASELAARGRDWSQVRPEWGLAGCSSFIAAPRHRTAAHGLQGRAFLHSYDWRSDSEFKVLELIMTAPMVVASWINLQYYASTLDNTVFGAGDKTLHNVVGRVGVMEGFGGDLRVGLPLQSVHDGTRFVHTPHRLNVVLEAPQDAINTIIGRHEHVRDLIENQWVHLFVMDDEGRISHRYDGGFQWRPVRTQPESLSTEKAA